MNMAGLALDGHGIAHAIVGDPTLFEIVFTDKTVRDCRYVFHANTGQGKMFNDTLRAHGLFKSAGKTYPSLALNEADFEITQLADLAAAVRLTATIS